VSAAVFDTCSVPALVANKVTAESCRPEPAPLSLGISRATLAALTIKARRVNDACSALGISRATLYKLAAQGKIRLVKIGGRTVVPESEIDRIASEGAA
jgi:excisionase family DNA binding protein